MIARITAIFTTISLFVTGFLVMPSAYYVSDFWAYQNLSSGSTAQIYMDNLELTERGRIIMAGANPKILPKSDFNDACQPQGQMIELGCYLSGNPDSIYVMQIQDPKVESMMGVTMAHEYMHAVYARLTKEKKVEVDALLEKQLPLIKDENLAKRLEGYAITEPGQQNNELHSIFATEYSNLLPELKTYYADYFSDRAEIVAKSQANVTYINTKEAALKAENAKIQKDKATLDALEARMNSYLKLGQISLYNSLVPTQNTLVRNLNAEIKTYNAHVAAYNDLIASISNRSYSSFDTVK